MSGATGAAPVEAKREPRTGPGVRRCLGFFAGYLLVSIWLWRSLVPHLATHAISGGLLDPGIFIWWLRWTPYALSHGLNPFRSTFLDAPSGVSAMWNTSVLPLGVLFAPVTLLFGAVVSFNLACILGPPLSAWTAWLWLRRHVPDAPAAVGGLVFGFSRFVIGQSHSGHLMFTWLFLLPVILMLVEDLLWRAPRPLWPRAPLLGLAVAVQFLIGSEALLILSLGVAGMVLLLAMRYPQAALRRLRILAPAAAVAVGVSLLLCAWPVVEQFGGHRAIDQPVQRLGVYGSRLPGWPLLVLIAVTVVILFRRPGVLIAAAAIVVSAAFQTRESRWHLAGHSITAPFRLLQDHVKITQDILPGRFAVLMWLAIAWLLAVALDAAMTRVRETRLSRCTAILPVFAAAVGLMLLVAGHEPTTNHLTTVPPLFETSLRKTIPNGSTVMLAPMATVGDDAAQLWQVEAGMRFRQLGGYMLHPIGRSGVPTFFPPADTLTRLFGINRQTGRPYGGPLTAAMLDGARAELRAAGVSMVIVGPSRYGEPTHLRIAEQLLGRPPDRRVGGVSIWEVSR